MTSAADRDTPAAAGETVRAVAPQGAPADLRLHYAALAHDADPLIRAVAQRQLAALRPAQRSSVGCRTAWLHVPLASLFEQAGNVLHARSNGTIVCGHEPVHGSRSGRCLVIWRTES